MNQGYARRVIEKINENPGVHYDELSKGFPDEEHGQLFRLLYGLVEKGVLTKKEVEPKKKGLFRGIERGIYWVNENNCTQKKLDETFTLWKL